MRHETLKTEEFGKSTFDQIKYDRQHVKCKSSLGFRPLNALPQLSFRNGVRFVRSKAVILRADECFTSATNLV